MKKILVLNGPNLNMLGVREPSVYGSDTLADLENKVRLYAETKNIEVTCFQSNSEAKLVRKIQRARTIFDGIIYNPGAHTHYSYALRDALGGIDIPCVEVHISDVEAREDFRKISVIAPVCVAQVKGRGLQGYCDAIDVLLGGACKRLGEDYKSRYGATQIIVGGQGERNAESEGSLSSVMVDKVSVTQSAVSRLNRVREACSKENIDAFAVCDTSSIEWLTAFDEVFDDEPAHVLLVSPHDAILHTDSRYSDAARMAAEQEKVIEINDKRVSHAAFIADCLSGSTETARTIGIEDSIELSQFRSFEQACKNSTAPFLIKETSNFLVTMRAVKEPSEIVRLRAAQAITDAAFLHIIGFIKCGMTEREIQIELEDYMRRHGAMSLAFPSIVATGHHGASPHAIPGDTRLESGQCLVLDFGAKAYGYCSDMTRTVFVGQPDERLRCAYEAIREANESVQAFLVPGVTGRQAHELAEAVLEKHGFGGMMGHGLGHGVGIDIHEEPTLSPRNNQPLVAGNVVTVEPGIYVANEFGMRLEDFGVITERGFEVFTQSSHDMIVL